MMTKHAAAWRSHSRVTALESKGMPGTIHIVSKDVGGSDTM